MSVLKCENVSKKFGEHLVLDNVSLEIKKGSKLTTEELREFYKTINHRLYSAVNEDLLSAALQTFETALP